MSLSVEKIKKENASFYLGKDDALQSSTYSRSLRFFNAAGGFIYAAGSTAVALGIKRIFTIYAFVLQAGQTDLGDTEVLEWADMQASTVYWRDLSVYGILALGFLLICVLLFVKFCIKKYNTYKYKSWILAATFTRTALQIVIAYFSTQSLLPSNLPGLARAAVLAMVFGAFFVVFIPGLFAAGLPYPLEFRKYVGTGTAVQRLNFWNACLNLLNSLADLCLRILK